MVEEEECIALKVIRERKGKFLSLERRETVALALFENERENWGTALVTAMQ